MSKAYQTLQVKCLNRIRVPQVSAYFGRIQESIVDFITANSRISPDTLRELMQRNGQLMGEAGSVVYGPEAVALGLCDSLGSLREALACLHAMIREARQAEGGEQV